MRNDAPLIDLDNVGLVLTFPTEFADVQRVFVPIDHQGHVGHVALVQSETGDPAPLWPAPQVAGPVSQSVGELLRLSFRGGQQATEGGPRRQPTVS